MGLLCREIAAPFMEIIMVEVTQDVRDLFGFVAPSEGQLSTISTWASKALELKAEIEVVEAHLNELNKELAKIEERDLPTAMMAAGTMDFTLTNGGTITIKDVIQGGLHKDEDKREFTLQWFVDNGGLENIKRHFEIDYTRGQATYAEATRKLLQENQVHFDEFESIHAGTMKAFLMEKLKEFKKTGESVPFDKMGLRFFKKAVIKQGENDED
jgi:hypothetical protein